MRSDQWYAAAGHATGPGCDVVANLNLYDTTLNTWKNGGAGSLTLRLPTAPRPRS